jgi:hypothetical protein
VETGGPASKRGTQPRHYPGVAVEVPTSVNPPGGCEMVESGGVGADLHVGPEA